MLLVNVFLASAVLCFDGKCYSAILGKDTPVGEFTLVPHFTTEEGYGGDVLVFKETEDALYSIHRTWPGREAMYDLKPGQRRDISGGCINLRPAIYERLRLRNYTAGGTVVRIYPGRVTGRMTAHTGQGVMRMRRTRTDLIPGRW